MASPLVCGVAKSTSGKQGGNDRKLKTYALYKQATSGDVTGSQPWAVQMEARVREESEYERYERGRPDMSRSVANRGCSDGANEEAFFARKSDERGEKRRATLKEDEGADRRVDAPGAGGGHEDRPGGGKRAAARDPIGSSFGRKTPSSMNPVVA